MISGQPAPGIAAATPTPDGACASAPPIRATFTAAAESRPLREDDPWLHRAQVHGGELNTQIRKLFVQVGETVGLRSILHTDFGSMRARLAAFGLRDDEGEGHEAI